MHSSLSNATSGQKADSTTNYDVYLKKAKEYGIKTFGFSEHGNILNHVKKKEDIEKHGMKYIHSVEAYLTEKIEYDENGKAVNLVRDNFHWVMMAKNYEGYKELNRLVSNSYYKDGHFYYAPRITMEEMMNTSDNIIHTTACLASPLWQLNKEILGVGNKFADRTEEDKERAQNTLDNLVDWIADNKHRVFLEVQYHKDSEQIEFNQMLLRLSNKTGAKLIAGTDTHSFNDDYAETRKALLNYKGASYGNEDDYDLTFKSYDEVVEAFDKQGALLERTYMEAIHNTNILGEMIEEFEHDDTPKYPKLYDNPEEEFKKKINEGFIKRGLDKKDNKQEYLDTIQMEYKVYKETGSINYMLLQKYIIDWCHENDIWQGYGRGSVNGSIIAYILGITEMDSVEHKLNFFRFINPERVSLPDIDVDFPPSRRGEVIEFLSTIEGIDFSEIVTVNSSKLKGSIRAMGGGIGMHIKEVDRIAKQVDEYTGKIPDNVINKYPELFRLVDTFNGTITSIGSHPSGFLVAPLNLKEHVGTMFTNKSKYKVSQLNMDELDGKNYVKLDILGLMNIELINETSKLAGIDRLTPDNLDTKDMDVWKSLAESTLGVFQFEGPAGEKYIEQLFRPKVLEKINKEHPELSYINLLSMANGAIRPSGNSYRGRLAQGMSNDNGHEALNELLKENMGYLLYQEDILNFLTKFAGFSGPEADTVRRGFAKKTGTQQYLPAIHNGFIKHMTEEYGETEENAEEILESFLQVIEDSSDYGFSLNHSQPYSYIGYAGAWLRHHYPIEFLTTSLNLEEELDQVAKVIGYAKKIGVSIHPIKFGKSKALYTMDKENRAIYKGIDSIKFLNKRVAEELYDLSQEDKYLNGEVDYIDLFVDIISRTSVNTRQAKILIELGFFDDFGSRAIMMNVWKAMTKDSTSVPELINPKYADGRKYPLLYSKSHKDNTKEKRLANIREYATEVEANPPKDKSVYEQIMFEIDSLGYANTTFPEVSNAYVMVLEMNLKYTPVIELYQLNTGRTMAVKIKKNKFYDANDEAILRKGDIIKIVSSHSEYGMQLVDGKWEENKSVTWRFIDKMAIVTRA